MNEPATTRVRRPKATTRTIILQKAYEMYLDGQLTPGDERLAVVLNALGYTTGAGYQIWANQAEFRADLAVYIAENINYASLRSIQTEIVELGAMDLPFEEHVLASGDLFMGYFLEQEDFYVKLRFVSMPEDRPSEITTAMQDAYEQASWEVSEVFTNTLTRFRRQLRPPLDMQHLTTAVTAAVEGYALRHRLQPERASSPIEYRGGKHHPFSVVFLAIVNEMTEPIPG